MPGQDGSIEIDTRIEKGNVEKELRDLQREIRNMSKEMQLANQKALLPQRKALLEVEKKYYTMAQTMGEFKGTTAEFMGQVQQLGAEHKKAQDAMINGNKMLAVSMMQTAGQMMNMTTQAQRISDNYDRMGNPMYKVNKAGLAIADGMNKIANNGNAAVLSLKLLGPTASMKQLRDMQMMINQGLMRYQMVLMAAFLASVVVYGALHKAAMSANEGYTKSFQTMVANVKKAFQPMVEVFAMIMEKVWNFINAVAEMVIKFNEAHPILAKIIQGILMLIPILTLVLAPLAIGIGLWAGMAAAMAANWAIIGPLVTGLLSMIGTVLLVSAALVAVGAGLMYLWKNNETFKNIVIASWNAIKSAAISVWQGLIAIVTPAFQAVVTFVKAKLDEMKAFWDSNGAQIMLALSNVWSVIKSIIMVGMAVLAPIISVGWMLIKSIIVSTWNAIQSIINGALNVINGIIQVFSGIFTGNFQAVWEGIKNIFQGSLQILWGWINLYFIGKFLGPLKAFGTTAKSLMTTVWNFIKGLFTNTLTTISNLVKSYFGLMSKTVSGIMNGIKSIISSAWNGAKAVVTTIVNGIKSIVVSVFNSLKGSVSSAMSGVRTAIINGWNSAKAFLSSINLTSIGKNIIQGLVNGIGSMVGAVTEKIKSVANTVKKGITGLLDIHSPSRWMRDQVGKMIPAGIAVGIEAKLPTIDDAMAAVSTRIKTGTNVDRYPVSKGPVDTSGSSSASVQQPRPVVIENVLMVDGYELARVIKDPINTMLGNDYRLMSAIEGVKL